MRCPECKTPTQPDASACTSCGLLLGNLKAPAVSRRKEDQALRRRAADVPKVPCPVCKSDVEQGAMVCPHCAEIIDADYKIAKARKRRARINYASWVAYLFGLITLLLFKPVGVLSIAAGLILSIIYYAIPVEASAEEKKEGSRFRRALNFVKRHASLERVSIPIPALRSKKLVFVGTPVIAALFGYLANFLILQQPMNQILDANEAFRGMSVSAHYQYWVVPGVVVYDLKGIRAEQNRLTVHTAFLEYAKKMKEKKFDRVELQYQGEKRASLDGASFQKIGEEYQKKNYAFVMIELPRRFRFTDQKGKEDIQIDSLIEFHDRWYANDELKQSIKDQAGAMRVSNPSPSNAASSAAAVVN